MTRRLAPESLSVDERRREFVRVMAIGLSRLRRRLATERAAEDNAKIRSFPEKGLEALEKTGLNGHTS